MTPERRGNGDGGFGGGGPGGLSGGGSPSFNGKWALYDEKYVLSGKGVFNAKAPQSWLQDLRNDLAGRSADLDAVLDWAEMQTTDIAAAPSQGAGDFPMFDQCPVEPKDVSRQLWAFLCPSRRGARSHSRSMRTRSSFSRSFCP